MSAPKSVTRYRKGNVEFVSNLDACEYYIFELCRGALRDVSKVIKKKYAEKYNSTYKKNTGYGAKNLSYKIWSSKNTKYPSARYYVVHTKKGTQNKGFYAYFQSVGSKNENKPNWELPSRNLLKDVIQENVSTIRQIESQYLSNIDGNPDGFINESEVDED